MIKFKFKKKGDSYRIKLKVSSSKFFKSISKLSNIIRDWIK